MTSTTSNSKSWIGRTQALLKNMRNHCRCICVFQCCVSGSIDEDIDFNSNPTYSKPQTPADEHQALLHAYFEPRKPFELKKTPLGKPNFIS